MLDEGSERSRHQGRRRRHVVYSRARKEFFCHAIGKAPIAARQTVGRTGEYGAVRTRLTPCASIGDLRLDRLALTPGRPRVLSAGPTRRGVSADALRRSQVLPGVGLVSPWSVRPSVLKARPSAQLLVEVVGEVADRAQLAEHDWQVVTVEDVDRVLPINPIRIDRFRSNQAIEGGVRSSPV